MMRIITGKARGTKLNTLAGDATRPTAERTKEAVFSMIQSHLQGSEVLDLFGGSGQLGLEAISRGAAHAVFVETAQDAMRVIKQNAEKTHAMQESSFFTMDAMRYLDACRQPFDIIFLDPPYKLGLVPACLSKIHAGHLLKKDGIVVCETGDPSAVFMEDAALMRAFSVQKAQRYGAAFIHLLTMGEEV